MLLLVVVVVLGEKIMAVLVWLEMAEVLLVVKRGPLTLVAVVVLR